MTFSLSTLAIVLGLALGLSQVYGFINPDSFRNALRKFPRCVPCGVVLMLLATAWFLYNLSQESIADFAAYKGVLYGVFAAVGVGSCIFVQDYLAVRGLALVLLLLAKLMLDTGRPALPHTHWALVIQALAYVFVVAGMWFTVSPWRLRVLLEWDTADAERFKLTCGVRLLLGLGIAVLGFTKF